MELRPNHEAPPWAPTNRGHGITSWPWGTTTQPSWKYVLTNEAPPWDLTKRFMELHPDEWGTTTKPSWNYVLTIPKLCLSNQHNIIIQRDLMPKYITNHTSHVFLPFHTLHNNISLTSFFINAYQCWTQHNHGSLHNNTCNLVPFKHT